jgi:hypothetical protein
MVIMGVSSVWRKHRNAWIIATVLTLAGLLSGAAFLLLRDDADPVIEAPQVQTTEFSRPRLVGWSKGQRQWSLEAQTMNDSGDRVNLEGIERGIIYQQEEIFLTFKAGQALWNKRVGGRDSSDLTLYGGVTVFENDMPVMQTARLEWQEATGLLIAPETVHFTYDDSKARASRLTLNPATEDVILEGDIDLALQDGTLIAVEGRLIYNMKTGSFRVEGMQHFNINT